MLPATLDITSPLDTTMGAMYIGVIASAVLHGLCLLQAFLYFQKYKQDLWFIKAAVLSVVFFDALHLIFIAVAVYHYVVRNFHSPDRLQYLTWPVLIEALLPGMNGAIVQSFYTFRIWRLSNGNYFLCGLIGLVILGEVGTGTTWVILSMQMETFRDLLTLSPLTITINSLSCTADLLIAASLCTLLHRARTGFKRSDSIINRLIIFVVNTGCVTTAFAFSALICLVASKQTLLYAPFYFCISRLYTNSFIATLNARSNISNRVDETELKPSSITPRNTTASHLGSKNINIRIETTHEATRDNVEKSMRSGAHIDSDDDMSTQKGRHF